MENSVIGYFVFFILLQNNFVISISVKSTGDFVDGVLCHAQGMEIRLKERLPMPRNGMWDLEVEGHPKCPGAGKTDVGGGFAFTILYSDKKSCGVEPISWFTPAWVSYAETTLILRDTNGTKIADSVSCVYNTRFDTSLLTFKGEITNQNLRYGGSLEEEGTDVETMVNSGNAVRMDFYDPDGKQMLQKHVKLGDPIMFRIDVAESTAVSKILPENCYFSSSSVPEENIPFGQTLSFVKKSCFNDKNGMVKAFLQKMERNSNGTVFELSFPAFHFTDFGRNLFVHCTILACVGDQKLCEPKSNCFGTSRRKRAAEIFDDSRYKGNLKDANNMEAMAKEVVLTKYIIVEDKRTTPNFDIVENKNFDSFFDQKTVCMQTSHFVALTCIAVICILLLIVIVSCMAGRLTDRTKNGCKEKSCKIYTPAPPAYVVEDMPVITSF